MLRAVQTRDSLIENKLQAFISTEVWLWFERNKVVSDMLSSGIVWSLDAINRLITRLMSFALIVIFDALIVTNRNRLMVTIRRWVVIKASNQSPEDKNISRQLSGSLSLWWWLTWIWHIPDVWSDVKRVFACVRHEVVVQNQKRDRHLLRQSERLITDCVILLLNSS